MNQDDKRRLKQASAFARELERLCDKAEKDFIPLQGTLVSAARFLTDPRVQDRIAQFQSKLSMVTAAIHQLRQKQQIDRDGSASSRIASRLMMVGEAATSEVPDGFDTRPVFGGQSPQCPLGMVMEFLAVQHKTGSLRVKIENETITFAVHRGDVVLTETDQSRRGERLGEILIANGDATFEHLMTFMDSYRNSVTLLGMAIVQAKIVTQDALTRALIEQTQRRFERVFAAKSCSFAFYEQDISPRTGLKLDLHEFLVGAGQIEGSPAPKMSDMTFPASAPSQGGAADDVWADYGAVSDGWKKPGSDGWDDRDAD